MRLRAAGGGKLDGSGGIAAEDLCDVGGRLGVPREDEQAVRPNRAIRERGGARATFSFSHGWICEPMPRSRRIDSRGG
jgi:hypothetical protein